MKYIVLLRGINISGKNKIAMAELKKILEENGYKDVKTYLNSGNVILGSDIVSKETLSQKIFETIKKHFCLEIPVFVITESELEDVLDNSPNWWDLGDKNIYNNLIFIIPPASFNEIYSTVGEPSEDIDKIEEYKNCIFWSFDLNNYRKSNWWVKPQALVLKIKLQLELQTQWKKCWNYVKIIKRNHKKKTSNFDVFFVY